MLVMLVEAMVPEPLETVQVWPVGLVLHRDAVGGAGGQRGGEGEGAVGAEAEVVTAVVLQHHGAGQPGNGPADRIGGTVRAGDGHVGDVGGGYGAGAAGDGAGLAGRVGYDRDAVGGAAGQRGGEGEGAVGGDAEVVTAVVLQHHGAGQPGNGPADR